MAACPAETTLPAQGKHVSSEKETAMNLTTITNIPSSNFKRLKGQYLATAAGMALVVSAVVAVGPAGTTAKPLDQDRTAAAAVTASLGAAESVILASVLSTERATFPGVDTVQVGEQVAAERGSLMTLQEQIMVGVLPAQREAADDDIAASVSSSGRAVAAERAALTTLQEQVLVGLMSSGQRQVSDADIAASVLSTELASYMP
jgi:hypothetical protein